MSNTDMKAEAAQRTLNDPRWRQVLERDSKADGQFYYSVKTTGVYCRPSCVARPARPENVNVYLTIEAAEAAGFRACRRCKPNQASLQEENAAKVAKVCRLIEESETVPSLSELAEYAELSTFHFHRLFKSMTGLTPKAYAIAHRSQTLRQKLDGGMKVTDAIYEAGYGSNSRFYESSTKTLGMKPLVYLKGGLNTEIHFALAECSLGSILVATSDKGVCAISIGSDPEVLLQELQDRFPRSNLIGGDEEFEALVAKVVGFIEAPRLGLELPLDVQGTAFQQRVWQALREIPYGETATYSDIASKIGMPKAVRAVASACAANTLAVAIPCHRVIRQDGSLSGYRWGIERKKALLKNEAAV
jgi:AraC family transcriptional regulator, regulatory protein of adaptative response / methylated-DNA-[protein]-cysteine methyltransferase